MSNVDRPLTPYKKCCEIRDGKIIRMWWEHPSGDQPWTKEEHDQVFETWREIWPDEAPFTDPHFLSERGFHPANVVRDGVRVR